MIGEIQIREVLPTECEDTGSPTHRAYAEYARPGDPVRDNCFGMPADVARRARLATVQGPARPARAALGGLGLGPLVRAEVRQ